MTAFFLYAFALIYLAMGIAMLIKPHQVKAGMDDMLNSVGLMFSMGVLSIFVGAFVVASHQAWGSLSEIIVSAIGWLALLKGLLLMIYPEDMKNIKAHFYNNDRSIRICGVGVVVLGGLFMGLSTGLI